MSWLPPDPSRSAGTTGGRVLPFKRRAVKTPRRRRPLAVILIRPFVTAVLLVGVPVVVGTWLLTTPALALDAIEIRGAERVPADWVASQLGRYRGDNLLRLDLESASRGLGGHPWLERLELAKRLPDRLTVTVHERYPVARVPRGDGFYYADAAGRLIAPADATGRTPDLLTVSGGGSAVPLALAIRDELVRSRPQWAAGLVRVEVLSEEDFRLVTEALPFPLVVRRGQVGSKLRQLDVLLPWLTERHGELAGVDLRFARQIIVQPATTR